MKLDWSNGIPNVFQWWHWILIWRWVYLSSPRRLEHPTPLLATEYCFLACLLVTIWFISLYHLVRLTRRKYPVNDPECRIV